MTSCSCLVAAATAVVVLSSGLPEEEDDNRKQILDAIPCHCMNTGCRHCNSISCRPRTAGVLVLVEKAAAPPIILNDDVGVIIIIILFVRSSSMEATAAAATCRVGVQACLRILFLEKERDEAFKKCRCCGCCRHGLLLPLCVGIVPRCRRRPKGRRFRDDMGARQNKKLSLARFGFSPKIGSPGAVECFQIASSFSLQQPRLPRT